MHVEYLIPRADLFNSPHWSGQINIFSQNLEINVNNRLEILTTNILVYSKIIGQYRCYPLHRWSLENRPLALMASGKFPCCFGG